MAVSDTPSTSGTEGDAEIDQGLAKIVNLLDPEDPVFAKLDGLDEEESQGSLQGDEDLFEGFGSSDIESTEDDQVADEDTGIASQKSNGTGLEPSILDRVLETFKIETSFFETQTLTYTQGLNIADASNDLERELEFYKQSLWAANQARKLFNAANKPFHRPNDYFAEMVKSDEHMERVRQRLLDESAAIKASEHARRQREIKKFGKKVQVAKQQEREKAKREMGERVKEFKKKRKADGPSLGGGGDEDFEIELEDGPTPKHHRGPNDKSRMPRAKRDAKYGHPKRSKENTRQSTGDMFSGPGRGGKSFGGRTGRGGAGASRRGAKQRPGKARRAAGRR